MKIFGIIFGIAFATLAGTALAEPAVVISGTGCGLPDGTGGIVFTTDTKLIATNNGNGNANLLCKAKDVPAPPKGAVDYNYDNTGFLCAIIYGTTLVVTDRWHANVSASGNATLTCHAPSTL